MLFEEVAKRLNMDESTVRFIWNNYWKNLQHYMAAPILPKIVIKHFGAIHLSVKDIDKATKFTRNRFSTEYLKQLREVSLKLKYNNK